jgi:hypothetical protein
MHFGNFYFKVKNVNLPGVPQVFAIKDGISCRSTRRRRPKGEEERHKLIFCS